MTIEPFILDEERDEPIEVVDVVPQQPQDAGKLVLFDKSSGELAPIVDAPGLLAAAGIIGLFEADTVTLAEFDDRARLLESIAKEARGLSGDELIRRLDVDACWTAHAGEWTITSLSPEAGTIGFDGEVTHAVLAAAVEHDAISQAAMDAAVRDVTPGPAVSWTVLREILRALEGDLDPSDEHALYEQVSTLLSEEPARVYSVQRAGINRLLKMGGDVKDAVEWITLTIEAPRRVAKIKRARS
jgi:hypothetical protein